MIESIPPRLLTDYDAQGCVVTTAQALDAGMDPRDVRRLVTTQQWVRLRRGAYTTRATYDGADEVGRHLLDARAAHLTLRAGRVFSHVTAAVIHGLPVHRLPLGEVHVTHVDGEGSGRHESGVWHHVGAVQEQDRVVRSGLPVLDLARTAFDVGRVAPTEGALVVADAVLRAGGTPSQLRDQLEAGRDWPGSRRAARPLLLADARAESPGESIARLAFHDIDLPPDELQRRLTTDAGCSARTSPGPPGGSSVSSTARSSTGGCSDRARTRRTSCGASDSASWPSSGWGGSWSGSRGPRCTTWRWCGAGCSPRWPARGHWASARETAARELVEGCWHSSRALSLDKRHPTH
jgi:hypothetical protein